ncbi:MAG TPA: F0F1 ATP synthase subunit delta [Patescibacteria group bacterium]|nr:F0F1 ATP synthase subunit delta [Patescibacteria group bacterium]
MQKISRRILAQTVTRELLAGKPVGRLAKQVAAYLVEHRMVNQAERLVLDIAAELQAATGHATAGVTTAFKPGTKELEALRSGLKHLTGAKEVELELREDKSLLGGVVVNLPGREWDASVRRKLTLLAREGA